VTPLLFRLFHVAQPTRYDGLEKRHLDDSADMPRDLMHYLGETFPGLILNPPLFYRWPVGLRFDLGGRATTPDEVDYVVKRATALFNAAFNADDMCIVVAQDWPEENRHPWLADVLPLFAFARGNGVGLEAPDGQIVAQDVEEPEIGPHTLTWVEQPARTFQHELVFEAIANADHARRPAISSRVYLINPLRNIILYMYDDRGLDLIAASKSVLCRFYRDFNAWILDYDRARIDQTFSQ
jgi:hypothetical protein